MQSEISTPFRLSTNRGVQLVTDPERQVHQHVMSLVNTEPGERVMMPDYGVRLASLLFENVDTLTGQSITDQIGVALATWEPGIMLNRAVPLPGATGEVRVDVAYTRRESAVTDVDGNRINVARIAVGGAVKEVIRG
jgi:phage baseplate assembly protein W